MNKQNKYTLGASIYPMTRSYTDEDTLRRLYHKEGMSLRETARELDCSKRTIQRWLDNYGISTDASTHEQSGPWRDREVMVELYKEQDLSIKQVADELGTAQGTVQSWLNKHDIETRESYKQTDYKWQDETLLRELHLTRQIPVSEIASEFGCSPGTIYNWLDEFDIPRLSYFPTVCTDNRGYVVARDGRKTTFNLHRLVAVAEYGYDEVVGKEVHHKNGIPWDNRPGNLQPIVSEEHARMHASEQAEFRERDSDGRFD